MNKTELVDAVVNNSGIEKLTKKDTEKIISAVIDTIVETVASGEKVQIVGFGTFEQRDRKERTGCDPRTGEQILIPASKVPAFKPGKAFKETVDKK